MNIGNQTQLQESRKILSTLSQVTGPLSEKTRRILSIQKWFHTHGIRFERGNQNGIIELKAIINRIDRLLEL